MTKEKKFVVKELYECTKRIEKLMQQLLEGDPDAEQIMHINAPEEVPEEVLDLKKAEEEITKILKELGMPAHLKGYDYIRAGVSLILEDKSYIGSITKALYPKIAKNFQTTGTRVERAIRHSIEVSCRRGNMEKMNEIFGYSISGEKGKPTNSEFIAALADYVRVFSR